MGHQPIPILGGLSDFDPWPMFSLRDAVWTHRFHRRQLPLLRSAREPIGCRDGAWHLRHLHDAVRPADARNSGRTAAAESPGYEEDEGNDEKRGLQIVKEESGG